MNERREVGLNFYERKVLYDKGIWIDAQGSEIPIEKMNLNHQMNTLRWIHQSEGRGWEQDSYGLENPFTLEEWIKRGPYEKIIALLKKEIRGSQSTPRKLLKEVARVFVEDIGKTDVALQIVYADRTRDDIVIRLGREEAMVIYE